MRATRIYTGPDGESHFEDLEIPITDHGSIGHLSVLIPATGLILRETGPDYDYDWHSAPRRQAIIMLSGAVEIEIGDGTVRRFGPGEILFAEDTTGRGHCSRAVDRQSRTSVFVTLD